MKPLSGIEFEQFLNNSKIKCADPKLKIGRELSFSIDPCRIVVVHFAENENKQYIIDVFNQILELNESWFVTPRYGTISDLGIIDDPNNSLAVLTKGKEKETLQTFLCGYYEPVSRMAANDIYLVSEDGQIIVTYDHHTDAEGLIVSSKNIAIIGKLLLSLNKVGAELELISNNFIE